MKEDRARTVLVVEPNHRGHRLYYVSLLARYALRMGMKVHLLVDGAAQASREWALHLDDLRPIEVHVRAQLPVLPHARQLAADLAVDTVIFTEADHLLKDILITGWKSESTLSLLTMRTSAQEARGLAAGAWSFGKLCLVGLTGCRRNVRSAALRSSVDMRWSPIRRIADPVTLGDSPDDRDRAREILTSDNVSFWVGVFGAIGPRKHLDMIAQAIVSQPNMGLVVAGTIDPSVRASVQPHLEELAADGRRPVLIDGGVADGLFDALIREVDCVAVAHSNEGPSGIVGKAAASGRRLALAGAVSLRRDARMIGPQARWSQLDAVKFGGILSALARQGAPVASSLSSSADEFARRLLS